MPRYLALPATLLIGSSGLLGAAADAAVVSLKAVKINAVPIAPTNEVTVEPGDIIETEVWLWGWEDRNRCASGSEYEGEPCITDADCGSGACDLFLVRIYQVELDGEAGFVSGDSGYILPVGWPTNTDVGAYIDEQDPDFLFHNVPGFVIAAVSSVTLDYRFGGIVIEDLGAPPVPGSAYYGGTLLLAPTTESEPEGEACGTFTISFSFVWYGTFLEGVNGQLLMPTPEALVVNVVCAPRAACCVWSSCSDLTEAECIQEGGTWYEAASCGDSAFECPARRRFRLPIESRD